MMLIIVNNASPKTLVPFYDQIYNYTFIYIRMYVKRKQSLKAHIHYLVGIAPI